MHAKIAQVVHDAEINPPANQFLLRLRKRVNSALFAHFARQNTLVDFQIGNYTLKLPYSHALPFIFKLYPQYSTNLGRIAAQVREKYPELTFIDIGANIGDTVALLRTVANFPILCIEGDAHFFKILQTNCAQFPDVALAKNYVGESAQLVQAVAVSSSGTAYLNQSGEGAGEGLQLSSLASILRNYPRFQQAKMLKVDTDGFDNKILRGSLDFLAAVRPVIFFEYDPHFLAQQQEEGLAIFASLALLGYQTMLVYENSGDFLMSIELADTRALEELNSFYSGRKGARYCDLCVFHAEDAELMNSIRQSELAFFAQYRHPTH